MQLKSFESVDIYVIRGGSIVCGEDGFFCISEAARKENHNKSLKKYVKRLCSSKFSERIIPAWDIFFDEAARICGTRIVISNRTENTTSRAVKGRQVWHRHVPLRHRSGLKNRGHESEATGHDTTFNLRKISLDYLIHQAAPLTTQKKKMPENRFSYKVGKLQLNLADINNPLFLGADVAKIRKGFSIKEVVKDGVRLSAALDGASVAVDYRGHNLVVTPTGVLFDDVPTTMQILRVIHTANEFRAISGMPVAVNYDGYKFNMTEGVEPYEIVCGYSRHKYDRQRTTNISGAISHAASCAP